MMDDVNYTPGERVRAFLTARATMTGTDRDTIYTVAVVGGTFRLLKADLEALSTPLRDAAPDMLEALKAVMAEYREGYGLNCADQVSAAITKATGGV